ncbi:MAG: TetR/AcrR family transcriptional regulator [Candidatus Riflebacteria bacterium]|nr:TetR/AcrR family transcriptional regulator [Candidatus Riflebacteria bacterium]
MVKVNLTKRQKEIIDTALNLTAKGGIQNLTIRNLAENLGITEPAIYRHFKNKSEIVKTMIKNFEVAGNQKIASVSNEGITGVEKFVKSRFSLVAANPPLAKVLFSEELFMDEPEYSELLISMMHKHKNSLKVMLLKAQEDGDIRNDIEFDMLFRLIMGPVRLLIKQWGLSNAAFNLIEKGDLLWESLKKTLKS